MRRGEVWWAELELRSGSEQRGRRPVVVLSHDAFNEVPTWRSVIVVPLTTARRQQLRGPTVAPLAAAETGLPRESFALGHQITTLDRSKLAEAIGRLGADSLRRVEATVLVACGIGAQVER
jgi:mRNA-degrading endonuclease toxin of MazEF toxin-antitoxin module